MGRETVANEGIVPLTGLKYRVILCSLSGRTSFDSHAIVFRLMLFVTPFGFML